MDCVLTALHFIHTRICMFVCLYTNFILIRMPAGKNILTASDLSEFVEWRIEQTTGINADWHKQIDVVY